MWLSSKVFIVVELFMYFYRKVSDLAMKQLWYSYGIHHTLFEILII